MMFYDESNKVIFCPFCDSPDIRFAGLDIEDVPNYACNKCNRYWNFQKAESKMNSSFWKGRFAFLKKSN